MNSIAVQQQVQQALQAQDFSRVVQLGREVFAREDGDEFLSAWVASKAYEHEVESGFGLLEDFVTRYPKSLHLPRVYLADLYSRVDLFESATEHARYYLRLVKERTWLLNPVTQEGICRAFLLLTCAYTQLGARSYSLRVIDYAMRQKLTPATRASLENERSRLQEELRQPEHAAQNQRWERFFATGEGAASLQELCEQRACPQLARRLEILARAFAELPHFSIDVTEIFLLLVEKDQHALTLS
ncbi:MAG: hypothetical protein ACRCV6_04975 [Formosimonas sp.]